MLKKPLYKVIKKDLALSVLEELKLQNFQEKSYDYFLHDKLEKYLKYVFKNSKFYRNFWLENNFHPDDYKTLDDFQRIPIVTKELLKKKKLRYLPLL